MARRTPTADAESARRARPAGDPGGARGVPPGAAGSYRSGRKSALTVSQATHDGITATDQGVHLGRPGPARSGSEAYHQRDDRQGYGRRGRAKQQHVADTTWGLALPCILRVDLLGHDLSRFRSGSTREGLTSQRLAGAFIPQSSAEGAKAMAGHAACVADDCPRRVDSPDDGAKAAPAES